MQQELLSNIEPTTKFDSYSKDHFIKEISLLESELAVAIKEIYRLSNAL